MELDKVIKERRSIRKFKKKDISWTKIKNILESSIYAPSAGNLQNLKLIITKNKGQLNKACFNQDVVCNCNFLVCVCSDDTEIKRHYKEKSELYSVQNTAAAIQNMLLKAYSLGIGSCWIGAFEEGELKGVLRIPDKIKVHALIAFGYPDEKPKMTSGVTLRDILSFDYYGNKVKDTLPLIKK